MNSNESNIVITAIICFACIVCVAIMVSCVQTEIKNGKLPFSSVTEKAEGI